MEILVYENNKEKDYQTVAVIDWIDFDQEVKKKPEDYVFILSSDEHNKFMELSKQIFAASKSKGMAINESEYIEQYPGIIAIAHLGLHPDFLKEYKIGSYALTTLGLSFAVYFINRSTSEVERSSEVLKRINDFRANTAK